MSRFHLKFSIDVGVLRRRALRKEIERYCFIRDYDLDLKESKGWFESTFFVSIKGPEKFGLQVKKDIVQWSKQLEEET